MATIDVELQDKLRADPEARVRLIVRVNQDPAACEPLARSKGLEVPRVFRLIKALAVEGPAAAGLQLAQEPWVTSVEEDKEVRTMP